MPTWPESGTSLPAYWADTFEWIPEDEPENVFYRKDYSSDPLQRFQINGNVSGGRAGSGIGGKGFRNSANIIVQDGRGAMQNTVLIDFRLDVVMDAPGLKMAAPNIVEVITLHLDGVDFGARGWSCGATAAGIGPEGPFPLRIVDRHLPLTVYGDDSWPNIEVDTWYQMRATFLNGVMSWTLLNGAGVELWTSPEFAGSVTGFYCNALVERPEFQNYEIANRIDNIVFGTPPTVTRLYPRDDGLGLSSAPRLYPPPKARRIVGGYL